MSLGLGSPERTQVNSAAVTRCYCRKTRRHQIHVGDDNYITILISCETRSLSSACSNKACTAIISMPPSFVKRIKDGLQCTQGFRPLKEPKNRASSAAPSTLISVWKE